MTISGPQANNWLAGLHPGGAHYGVGERVVIGGGPCAGQSGEIVTLAELEPEPIYLVSLSLERGHYTQVPQSVLARR